MKRLMALLAVAGVATLGMTVSGGPALAAFPGTNGRIAFSTGGDGSDPSITGQIFTVRPDGTGLRRLTHVPKGKHAISPSFSPDGRRIAYQSDQSGTWHIWIMNADGSGQTRLTNNPNVQDLNPSWSPDGSSIVFARCFPQPFGILDCHIAVMSASGGAITVLTHGHWGDADPEFSPDGTRIAFDSNRRGLEAAVWVMNANGTDLRRLTAPRLEAFWPDWSPDGSHIAFQTNCCVAGSDVWVMGADGSRPHALTNLPSTHNAGFERYSPDGTKMVLQSDLRLAPGTCCGDVYVMNANGTDLHRIVASRTTLFTDWGPAG